MATPLSKNIFKRLGRAITRIEKRVLIAWIRFAKRHRESNRLPVALFILFFLDGFVMVVPSTLVLAAAVTITPRRWILFFIFFAAAATMNNAITYYLGRSFPPHLIEATIVQLHLVSLWESAKSAFHSYGPWASFVGAIIGLPTQLVAAALGIADAKLVAENSDFTGNFARAMFLTFSGHGLKAACIAAIVRFGWVKLERKLAPSSVPIPPKQG